MKNVLFITLFIGCAAISRAGDGPVLYYSFNKPIETVVADESGSHCDGTAFKTVQEPGGVNGDCLRFDGVHSFVRVSRNPTTSNRYTVSLWFKPDTTEPAALYERHLIAMNRRYQIGFMSNGPHVRFYSYCQNNGAMGYGALRTESGVFDLKPGQWNHVVMVAEGGASFYLNGRPLGFISGPGPGPGHFELLIGAMNNDPSAGPRYFFPGLIDEVRIYDRVLGHEEILALFRKDAPKELLPAAPVELGPSYVVKDGRFYLRTETGDRLLTDDEVSKLLATAGGKSVGQTAPDEDPTICEIGFSNDPKGDQDVTYFLPSETLHVRMTDVDIPLNNTNYAVQVFLSQKSPNSNAAEPKQTLLQLKRTRGGTFKGELPLNTFEPGPIWISVVASEPGGNPILMRTSRIHILEPKPAPPP